MYVIGEEWTHTFIKVARWVVVDCRMNIDAWLMTLFFPQCEMLYTTLTADLNIDSSGLIMKAGKPDSIILY